MDISHYIKKLQEKFLFIIIVLCLFCAPLKSSHDLLDYDGKPIKVLSFDGGGMRGLFSLRIAEALEKELPGGKKLFDFVDFFAGSSTGGMISAALADGHAIQEGLDLYTHNGSRIFPPLGFGSTLKNLMGPIYSATPLEEQLKELFGDKKFNDIQKGVIVPTINIETVSEAGDDDSISMQVGQQIFNSKRDCTWKAWEVCRATASAPTYFEPFYPPEGGSYIDGGIIDNRPILTTAAEIQNLYKPEVRAKVRENIKIVSIGTGMFYETIARDISRRLGLAGWAKELSTISIRDSMGKESNIVRSFFGDRFVELNALLPEYIALHATDSHSLGVLESTAKEFIASKEGRELILKARDLLL